MAKNNVLYSFLWALSCEQALNQNIIGRLGVRIQLGRQTVG